MAYARLGGGYESIGMRPPGKPIGAIRGRPQRPIGDRPITHMPKGATQSPKGDLGKFRVMECDTQRGFKNRGKALSGSEAFGANVGTPGHMGEKDSA